jgi:hypothetical protein
LDVLLVARPGGADVEGLGHRDAGPQQDPQRPREARLDPEADKLPDDRQADRHPVTEPADRRGVADEVCGKPEREYEAAGRDPVGAAERSERA